MTGPLTEFELMMVRILIWSQIIGAAIGKLAFVGKPHRRS